ncbi:MAG: exodeoxyribonuclease VII large subunit [Gammaproteobacteria bacterium]|uniref:Exodeoxyribonuclease 7 large subunit n=1 Tax=Tolumonas osonensis TaxID=675874 RepID=A0A841GJ84_9GAMM|nr:exodeoxyribonuclease VII large subunit [Tolumonas osonensis]NCB60866.1 exodeoxyribonuclease VII large subunit [Gammaproteobacteria bacterium]
MAISQPVIYTVSRLNNVVRLLLEQEMGLVWLTAEISNLVQHSSGHWYFTLKDQQAQIKAAMFKGQNRRVSFRPQNGQQVLVQGQLSLYEARGDYQLIVEKMQPAGDGLLQMKLEALKTRLIAEGLFDPQRKRPLPSQPRQLGIITSPTGAAIHDMLTILARRDPALPVILYPSAVQGEGAVPVLLQALETAWRRNECDLLIIGRGGGSLEDLWCFNDERVVRAIATSPIPIVSAVGHETDVTLSDFAADLRAPTPSAAAELVSRDQQQQLHRLTQYQHRLQQAMQLQLQQQQLSWQQLYSRLNTQNPRYQLQQKIQKQDELQYRLEHALQQTLSRAHYRWTVQQQRLQQQSPQNRIQNLQHQQTYLYQRLLTAVGNQLQDKNQALSRLSGQLQALSPLQVLARGYSVTTNTRGELIHNSQQVSSGDTLNIQLHQGTLKVRAEEIKPEN